MLCAPAPQRPRDAVHAGAAAGQHFAALATSDGNLLTVWCAWAGIIHLQLQDVESSENCKCFHKFEANPGDDVHLSVVKVVDIHPE